MTKRIFLAICCIISTTLFAQQGRDGSPTITTSTKVNEYTYLTANAAAGNTTITVASSTLNTHGRFTANLATGDLIMIIQMQGATLNGSINGNTGLPKDSTWGAITNYNNCGNYEFAEVGAVPSATTIQLDCPLQYSYTSSGKVQIVRVPRYGSLTINSGGTITCDQWDSAIGGIVAIEVQKNTVINSGGAINADSAGFRGGRYNGADSTGWGIGDVASRQQSFGKEKGEGIGGYEWSYAQYGGKNCMGAPGNAGGGGSAQNGGGGGGANGGVVANYINGYGNPNVSTADNITAWKLEDSWLATFTSAGGGRGGYSFSGSNENPLVDGPGNTIWTGDYRRNVGGRGGRPLDYSTGKIFMGGGGGAGDQNDDYGGMGGKGGGIIYLMSYGTISGAGQIISNGENGFNTPDPSPGVGHASGIDGAGGAGGGGTIIVNSVGAISGVSLTANGGTGGNQVIVWDVSTDEEAEGPGGGGGGGYIATSNTGLAEYVLGGTNGTTNAKPMTNFLPNGATMGSAGTTGASITNYSITAKNDTICSGQSATLTATINGTAPGGTSLEWYTVDSGGVAIASGDTYTTPVLTNNITYYIGTCPGTYRIAITVVISGAASVTINRDTSICKGSSLQLNATGGSSYSWTPTTGLNYSNISNPVATPTTTTTYTASITTTCGIIDAFVKVTVVPIPSVTIIASTNPICAGSTETITAGGGTSYVWTNGETTSSITVKTTSTTTYTVGITNNGCTKDTNIKITVNPLPIPGITATNTTVCSGNPTTITATGGTSYLWSNTETTSSITVTPTTGTDTYTVGISNGLCEVDTSIAITVNQTPVVSILPVNPVICATATVALAASGASSYTWTPPLDLTCTTCPNPTASPTSTTTYTAVGSTNGCTNTATVTVTVGNTVTAKILGDSSICVGSSTTLTASGGTLFTWSNGATTSSINIPGSSVGKYYYTVIVSSGSCIDSTKDSVLVKPLPMVTINHHDTTICKGSSVTLTATGGGTYVWSNSSTSNSISISPTSQTTYTAEVTENGCINKDTVTVGVAYPFSVNITQGASSICPDSSVTLKTSGGGTYKWSTGATADSIVVRPTSTTNYSVVVTNVCTATQTATVTIVNPVLYPCCDTTIQPGSFVTLDVSGASNYVWTPSTGVNCTNCTSITVSPTITTTYTVTGTDQGCPVDSVITVTVECTTLTIPNVFTPSYAGHNGEFYIDSGNLSSWSILIFDRWGREVFKSGNPTQYWDGNTESGGEASAGVYYYTINASCNTTSFKKDGFVQVIR